MMWLAVMTCGVVSSITLVRATLMSVRAGAAELKDSGAVGKFWKPSAKITTGAWCQSMPLYVKKAHKRQIHWSVD